jgi:hypothetical protein
LAQTVNIYLIINVFNFAAGIFPAFWGLLFSKVVNLKSGHGCGRILMFVRTQQGMFLSAKINFVRQKHLAPEGEELFRSHNSVTIFKWMKQKEGR